MYVGEMLAMNCFGIQIKYHTHVILYSSRCKLLYRCSSLSLSLLSLYVLVKDDSYKSPWLRLAAKRQISVSLYIPSEVYEHVYIQYSLSFNIYRQLETHLHRHSQYNTYRTPWEDEPLIKPDCLDRCLFFLFAIHRLAVVAAAFVNPPLPLPKSSPLV